MTRKYECTRNNIKLYALNTQWYIYIHTFCMGGDQRKKILNFYFRYVQKLGVLRYL